MRKLILLIFLLFTLSGFSQVYKLEIDSIYIYEGDYLSVINLNKKYINKYNSLASNLFIRMYPQLPDTFKRAISNEFDTLQLYHIDTCLAALYFNGFATTQQSTRNLLRDSFNLVIVNDAQFLPYRGFKGNGSDMYLNTQYNPYTAFKCGLNNASITFKSLKDTAHNGVSIGIRDGSNMIYLQTRTTTDKLGIGVNAGYDGNVTSTNSLKTFGLSRTGSANYKVYTDGDSIATVTNTSVAIPNKTFLLLARNYTAIDTYDPRTVGGASFGYGLTTLQMQKLYEIYGRLKAFADQYSTDNNYANVYQTADIIYKKAYVYSNTEIKIIYQTENMKFGSVGDTLYFSIDNGLTYPYKTYNVNASSAGSGFIFSTGQIYFANTNNNTTWVSYDSLQTVEAVPLYIGDQLYVKHTPANASYPGNYFKVFTPITNGTVDGIEMMFFGNYGNAGTGANPANCYYGYINADTLVFKVADAWGQNPNFRDDGTANGGVTGTLLGNAANSRITRHFHGQQFNDSVFWVFNGDNAGERIIGYYKYNLSLDTFTFTQAINTDTANKVTYYRSIDWYFHDQNIIIGGDGATGIWSATESNLNDTTQHIHVVDIAQSCHGLTGDGQYIFGFFESDSRIAYSKNYGVTWKYIYPYEITLPSDTYSFILPPDEDGYFAFRTLNFTILIKPK
jgi:hypothetical protein